MSIVQMVLPLIGVVVGALGSYLAASAGERSRWRRYRRERWDARRIGAYVEYELSKRITDPAAWELAVHQFEAGRDRFYRAARRDRLRNVNLAILIDLRP